MKVQEKSLVRTLQQLVRIPSHESCDEISKYVASEIRKLGINPVVDKDGNIIARIGKGPAFLLNAHLDTVGIEGYNDPYSGKVKGNKLFGRGSTDCKSGVAAMLEIMSVLKRNSPRRQVIFTFTVWEERGEKDGAYKVVKKIKPTHGLVLEDAIYENGKMGVFIGCKGRFQYDIDVLGKAGHSGSPNEALNSIYLASKLVGKIRNLNPSTLKIPGYGKVQSSISITEIEAKEGKNVIPGKCSLTIDYRSLPKEKEVVIRRKIHLICKNLFGKSFKLFFKGKQGYLKIDNNLISLCKSGVKEAGLNPVTGFSPGWNDATVFNNNGIIAFKMGPGTIGQDHKNPEYCWIPGLVKGTQAILNVIRRWNDL